MELGILPDEMKIFHIEFDHLPCYTARLAPGAPLPVLSVRGHSEMRDAVLKLDPRDNVLIALRDLRKCEQVSGTGWVLRWDVPAKHKFAAERTCPGQSREDVWRWSGAANA